MDDKDLEFKRKYNELKSGYISNWYVFIFILCIFDIVCTMSFDVSIPRLISSFIVLLIGISYCLWVIKRVKENY